MTMRIGTGSRRIAIGVAIGAVVTGWTIVSLAQDAPQARQESAAHSTAGCVEVEVNGMRSPSYDCLTDKLKPANAAASAPRALSMESEAIAQRPGNQLGVFNWSATSQRMGNTFGTSATPQRPATPVPTSPLVRPAP